MLDRARTETARLLRRQSFQEYVHRKDLIRPRLKHLAPLFEKVGSLVGTGDRVPDRVHEAGFPDFKINPVFCGPLAEG